MTVQNENLIKKLQDDLPWSKFIASMKGLGFNQFNKIEPSKISSDTDYRDLLFSGNAMIVNSLVQSSGIHDPSLLSLTPHIIFRPRSEEQLKKIVIQSQKFQIPITFAGGKTGLSGGFANYGIVVDLVELHSYTTPYKINLKKAEILVEQGVLVSDLIKIVPNKTKQEFIFPTQPASALKLPVRVGGLIASNASGVTSGKLGAAKEWIKNLRIMTPKGNIIGITPKSSLFERMVGGNGYFGVVLGATFRLYNPEENLERAILYGFNLNSAFFGLQAVLDKNIFPLVSEFVSSHEKLPGIFNKLDSEKNVKWAAIIKGNHTEVESFIEIMLNHSNCHTKLLDEEEFQEYLQERSAFALLVQASDDSKDYIAFPGFEDILSQPKFLPDIIETINNIFEKNGFHKVIFGYGHINFRKGKGLLLHVRLPVPLEFFYDKHNDNRRLICETVYDVIMTLRSQFDITHKAEHSPGPFRIWLDSEFRSILHQKIIDNEAFFNPNLIIIEKLFNNLEDVEEIYKKNLEEGLKKELFISAMLLNMV